MTAKSLAELALKIWGVIMLVGALTALPVNLAMLGAFGTADAPDALFRTSQTVSTAATVFHAFVAFGLILWCDRIVDWIVPEGPTLRIAIRESELRAVAFAVIGLSVFLDGAQNAAVVAFTLYSKPSIESETWSYLWTRQRDSLIRAVVQLVAGFLLLGGRAYAADIWTRMRGEPLDDYEEDLPTETPEKPET
jgi:hypothetical protein